jgi:hypothetical protein
LEFGRSIVINLIFLFIFFCVSTNFAMITVVHLHFSFLK